MEGVRGHAAAQGAGERDHELAYSTALPPIGGEPEAVELATLYRGTEDPIRLRGGFRIITPGWAKAILPRAMSTGKHNERDILVMAHDMAAVHWRVTGDAIVIDELGRVVKGRKRLTACIQADTPFVCLVLVGISSKGGTIDTVGTGRSRLLSDILKIAGFEPHRSLATALPLVWRLRLGGAPTGDRSAPGDLALLELLHANPDLRAAMATAQALERGRIMRMPLFASMAFLFGRVDRERAQEFLELLKKDGLAVKEKKADARLPETHPVRHLNDLFLSARAQGRDIDRSILEAAATVITAWNAFVTGIPPKAYRWRKEDADSIPFPLIAGWTEASNVPVAREGAEERRRDWQQAADLAAVPASEYTQPQDVHTAAGAEGAFVEEFAAFSHPLSERVWSAAFPDGEMPTVSLEMIDPEKAERFLAKNTNNRGQKMTVVEKYRRDMDSGTFASLNGQTVKEGKTGRLLDAQHRLQALVLSGKRLPFVVVRGLEEAAIEAMDRGHARAFRKVLEARGHRNSGILASAARLMWYYDRSRFAETRSLTPSIPELSQTIADHPDLLESLRFANPLRGYLTPGVACFVEYMLTACDTEKARYFLSHLSTGEDLKRGDPILVLRRILNDAARTGAGRRRRASPDEGQIGDLDQISQAALTMLAWNAWTSGRTVRTLSWRRGEPFPEPAAPGRA